MASGSIVQEPGEQDVDANDLIAALTHVRPAGRVDPAVTGVANGLRHERTSRGQ
jgi:hypothetical protein